MSKPARIQPNKDGAAAPGVQLGAPRKAPARLFDRGLRERIAAPLGKQLDEPSKDRPIARYKPTSRHFPRRPRTKIKPTVTAQELLHGIGLRGKTALVTDVDTPLGFEIMRVLCLRGAQVFGTGKSLNSAKTACDMIAGKAVPFACDFSDLASVSDCAAEIAGRGTALHMLICQGVDRGVDRGVNTGVSRDLGLRLRPRPSARTRLNAGGKIETATIDGIRRQNPSTSRDVGCFLLIERMLDLLKQADDARIVIVTSPQDARASLSNDVRFDEFLRHRESRGNPAPAPARGDPAPFLLTGEFARRLDGSSLAVNAVAVGLRAGAGPRPKRKLLGVNVNALRDRLARKFGIPETNPVALAAAGPVYAATNPRLKGVSGCWFDKFNAKRLGRPATDRVLTGRLWNRYCELTKYY